ncbi:histidine-type phosphatase [Streptomyces sp. ACT015]|uniref:histidine-type phosphatase n=1 Tax=Streptomyces sp. ACT015 TaxID=3134807 RepID=UPI003D176CAD
MKRLAPALALCALLVAALPAHAADQPAHRDSYGTKAPYAPGQSARTYQAAPAGYVPVLTENVSRHGSRAASDGEDADLVLALWDRADASGQLTREGREFGTEVRALRAAMERVGFGELSGRGRTELAGTATRLAHRLPALFAEMARTGQRIDVVSSGQGRAVDSGDAFAAALAVADPGLRPLIGPTRPDRDLLYFHKTDAGAAYRDYVDNDPRLAATLASLTDQPRTRRAATGILRRLFTGPFVAGLGDTDRVAAARAVHSLYAIAPAMSEESPGGRGWGLERRLPAADAAWFGYLDDVEDFYEKGPGFSGDDITYRMAGVLLDDLFRAAEQKRDGVGDLGAVLRFTHAEELIPLAALMGLPGSTEQVTGNRPYTWAGNPWRGARVAPLGGNIQWDVYRRGDRYLVRMLYNERETPFRAGCRPVARGSVFYDLDELERCFGRA